MTEFSLRKQDSESLSIFGIDAQGGRHDASRRAWLNTPNTAQHGRH
jgi:hypothetical protein